MVLRGIAILLLLQLVGEAIVQLAGLPFPGPVVGMGVLFGALIVRGETPSSLRSASRGLLRHFPLLFVPAGVGVLLHLDRLAAQWFPIAAALVVSLVLTFSVTALVTEAVARQRSRR